MQRFFSDRKRWLPRSRQRRAVWVFFGALLLLGSVLVRGYGHSVDEQADRRTGMVTLRYVSSLVYPAFIEHHADFARFPEKLADYTDRDYGVAFQLPVTWLEQVLNLPNWRAAYLLRHWCTFLVSVAGVLAMYRLARRRFGDWRIGLLGAGLLVLSPRLFADFFYNDKDAVFMALLAIGLNTLVAFVQRPTRRSMAWHALACALAIDARIMGVLLPAATGVLLAVQLLKQAYAKPARTLLLAGGYFVLLWGLVIAFWPYLWAAPLPHFKEAFNNMSQFRWQGEVLYMGRMVPGTQLPWHYAPVWITLTTPLLYLAAFGVGALLLVARLLRRNWRLYGSSGEWQDLLFLGMVLAPLAAVIKLHSVLYDGWRQLYFIYPALLLVALRGLVAVARWQPLPRQPLLWRRLCYGGLAAGLLAIAGQMVAMHPLQNVYFNALAGPDLEHRFELDYWLLSYRQGLDWVARHDDRPTVKVSAQFPNLLEANRWMLPDAQQTRLQVVTDPKQADYYLSTHRYQPQQYPEYPYEATNIRADGSRVLTIYQLALPRW